jgi:hypothetical protein
MKANSPSPRWRLGLIVAYSILLLISHLVRRNRSAESPLTNGKQLFSVQAGGGEKPTEQKVRMAFREFSPSQKDSLPILI